jgi:hypothetical protein
MNLRQPWRVARQVGKRRYLVFWSSEQSTAELYIGVRIDRMPGMFWLEKWDGNKWVKV